jgi:putative glycosyltransferase (TIGR04372 family)
MKRLLHLILRRPLIWLSRLAFIVVGMPVLFMIEPFKKLRFSLLYTKRIGHLSGNSDVFLRRLQIGRADPDTCFILAGVEPVNRQLFEMLKRVLPIYESRWLTRFLFYIRPVIRKTRFWEDLEWDDPDYEAFNKGSASLYFTAEEEERGRIFLRSIGITEDDWFVCLHNRDAAYLDAYMPENKTQWRTTDHRNSEIENYMKAAEYITSKGGYVLRMGAIVGQPLPEHNNPKIIDYASLHRSDFLDIYLPSKCRFFLGCDSGIFVIATIFDVPVALANCNLIAHNPFRRSDLFLLTRLKDTATGKFVPYDKALEVGYYNIFYAKPRMPGYQIVENTPDEILALAQEMLDRLEGNPVSPEGHAANVKYRERYVSEFPYWQHSPDLCSKFVLNNWHLFAPEPDQSANEKPMTPPLTTGSQTAP